MITLNGVGITTLKNAAVTKQALSAASINVPKGVYDATTLPAVDPDHVAGNIKSGVTDLGVLGTLPAGTATHDIEADALTVLTDANASAGDGKYGWQSPVAGADVDLATLTQTYAAGSVTEAFGYFLLVAGTANTIKLRLYADGVQIGESAYIPLVSFQLITVNGNKALSGIKIVKIAAHNYDVVSRDLFYLGRTPTAGGAPVVGGVFAGSVKVV